MKFFRKLICKYTGKHDWKPYKAGDFIYPHVWWKCSRCGKNIIG